MTCHESSPLSFFFCALFLLTKLRFRRQCQEDAREGEKTIGPYSRADPSTAGGECEIASTARLDGQ